MLVSVARQAEEANLFPSNQLGFGGNLKADSGGSGFLQCHPIAAAVGFLFFIFLRSSSKVVISVTVAEGEADCSVPSDEELDELVEVELDLPSS
jgi:hypothetical protein